MRKGNTTSFIEKSKKIHGNKYDYSKVNYLSYYEKVDIICYKHGLFKQRVCDHIKGQNCPECGKLEMINKLSHNNEIFINKAKKVHGDKYDYSLVDYKNAYTYVLIKCKLHGEFKQKPSNHLNKQGCPHCNTPKMENFVKSFLESEKISYITQKTFDGCKHKRKLKFDFYLPDHNICIECDGEQHYRIRDFNGGLEGFKYTQILDNIKNDYCLTHNIKLIRIKYNDSIEDRLKLILTT